MKTNFTKTVSPQRNISTSYNERVQNDRVRSDQRKQDRNNKQFNLTNF